LVFCRSSLEPSPAMKRSSEDAQDGADAKRVASAGDPSQQELIGCLVQLMTAKGSAVVAEVRRRADADQGFSLRGVHMDASVLREALAKIPVPTEASEALKVPSNVSDCSSSTQNAKEDESQATSRQQHVDLIVQLMTRKGSAAVAEVKRKVDAGESICIRGATMDASVLREALTKLPASPTTEAEGAGTPAKLGQSHEDTITPEKVHQHPSTKRWFLESASVWVRDYGSVSSASVAAFDLDGTLIKTACDGQPPLAGGESWAWWHESVPARLQALSNNGYKIVVFCNMSGISLGKLDEDAVHTLIDDVQKSLGVPLMALIATQNDIYHKPRIGLWKLVAKSLGKSFVPDRKRCFFIGDAAGRPGQKGAKGQSADADLKFALNLGIDFQTPGKFFLNEDIPVCPRFSFDPRKFRGDRADPLPNGLQPSKYSLGKVNEVVLLVGAPCSGKTTLVKSCFSGHVYINQNELKTKEKCVKACNNALKEGRSVVIDNQNRDTETRALYVNTAKCFDNVPVRVVYLDVPKQLCFHLNRYRAVKGGESLPRIAVDMYYSREQTPVMSEGFFEILHLTLRHFAPVGTPADLALIQSFLD